VPELHLINFNSPGGLAYDTCSWKFGDGGAGTNCDDPSCEYKEPGIYAVILTLIGPGCTITEEKKDYIMVENYFIWLPVVILGK
jgi:PKD repeat protein